MIAEMSDETKCAFCNRYITEKQNGKHEHIDVIVKDNSQFEVRQQ